MSIWARSTLATRWMVSGTGGNSVTASSPGRLGGSGTGVVELPNHYRHAWRMRDGTYVLTDSPNFDPQRDAGQAGEQLQRAPR